MQNIELPMLDRKQMLQRIVFLECRADAHIKMSDLHGIEITSRSWGDNKNRHLACAGTLFRDAGAIALLLGDVYKAKDLLGKAGKIWSGIGLFAGYLLFAIVSPQPWWLERRQDLKKIESAFLSELSSAESFENADMQTENRSFLLSSLSSERQLLDLYNSLYASSRYRNAVKQSNENEDAVAKATFNRLIDSRVIFFGGALLSVTVYFDLLDGFRNGELNRTSRETLISLIARRQERINTARKDAYRWRMMEAPAEVIDFDFLMLSLIATRSGNAHLLEEDIYERDLWVKLPFKIAQNLDEFPPR